MMSSRVCAPDYEEDAQDEWLWHRLHYYQAIRHRGYYCHRFRSCTSQDPPFYNMFKADIFQAPDACRTHVRQRVSAHF